MVGFDVSVSPVARDALGRRFGVRSRCGADPSAVSQAGRGAAVAAWPPDRRSRRRPPRPAPPPRPRRATDAVPTEATLGVPIFPGAQFIASYDAGRGQRYYIFGSPATFVDLVAYYRTVLKQKGELVYDVPATHEFDVGKYREETMAFPPGVTIKDYQSDISQGYPNPKPGGQPARFPDPDSDRPGDER